MAKFIAVGNNLINLDRAAVVWDRPHENLTTVIFDWVPDGEKSGRLKPCALDFYEKEEREALLKAVRATM